MKNEPGKVGYDNVTRNFLFSAVVLEAMDVLHGLAVRLIERLSKALVLDKQCPWPEQINISPAAG